MIPLYVVEIGRQRAARLAEIDAKRRAGLRRAAVVVAAIVAVLTVAAIVLEVVR